MPIVDYPKVRDVARERFFADDSITPKNKEWVRKFLQNYEVKNIRPARQTIFLKHVVYLLRLSQDIKKDMNDREKINSYFAKIHAIKVRVTETRISDATYLTIVNVTNAFVRWLNGGEKPKGFKDIKNGKRSKRDLTPDDMVTWEDVKKMIQATPDIQLQAIIALQCEGGLRPSEFIDLKYGDIKLNGNGITKVSISGTKTAASQRVRHLYRATPYIQKWIMAHPLQNKNSPLWIIMRNAWKRDRAKMVYTPYGYRAVQFRVIDLGQKVGIEKPLDFYCLRHSAIVMSKTDGLADSIAMKEFGHATTRMYSEVYGRLSDEDQRKAIEKIHGLENEKIVLEKNAVCRVCKFTSKPGSDYCENCSHPLSSKAVEDLKSRERQKEQQLQEIKDTIKKELMQEILAEMRK